MGTWGARLGAAIGIWLVLPVIYFIVRFIVLIWPGHGADQSMDLWASRNFGAFTASFWILAVVLFFICIFACGAIGFDDDPVGSTVAVIVFVVTFVFSLVMTFKVADNNDKDYQRYYAKSVTFYVPDVKHPPNSLTRLTQGAHKPNNSACDLVNTNHDVVNCIKQGTLSPDGWDARVSSLNGADYALTHSSSYRQNVDLDSETLTYLNAWHGQPARWSGIMDGSGSSVPMGGVAEWDGHKVTQCDFDGKYDINRALKGDSMNDMEDLLAEKYPDYWWNLSDVWGYCNGKEPIVVVPMIKQEWFKHRTVDTPAGFVLIQGDHKNIKFTYKSSAKPGEYPGPVYPSSIVDTQRYSSEWAAGRKNQDQNGFGYEPATSDSQAGNVADYLLRDKVTGRLQWVTPLTLRGSKSQIFVAYAVSTADEFQAGRLNPISIYVLRDSDPLRINIDNMESDARNYLATQVPGFAGQQGQLLEFTPVGGNTWRAYGEIKGRVEYLLDINVTNISSSVLTDIGGSTNTTGGNTGTGGTGNPGSGTGNGTSNTACGQPLGSLTQSQLTNCLAQLANELNRRQTATPPK